MEIKNFEGLKGHTLTKVETTINEMVFTLEDGVKYMLCHYPDCGESVTIEDICGELDDLVGVPILIAEEVSGGQGVVPEGFEYPTSGPGSFTWTFYKLATIKGYVTVRWFGESNGYYSETVDWMKKEG